MLEDLILFVLNGHYMCYLFPISNSLCTCYLFPISNGHCGQFICLLKALKGLTVESLDPIEFIVGWL